MASNTFSYTGIVQRHIFWIFVGVVTVAQLIPLLLADGHCEKPICYAVDEIDPRNRHIHKIDCNRIDEIKDVKTIRYSCASDIRISELIHGTEPQAVIKDETPPTVDPPLDSSFKPLSTMSASKEITEKFIFTFLAVKCIGPTTEIFIGTKFSDVGASGNISFPLIDIPDMTFSLNPGSGQIFEVPLTAVPIESELNQKVNTSVVIDSDEEVVAYGHQRCHGSSNYRATAFRVRGTEDLGTEYWVITHQSVGKSQVGVVATKDHTNISFNGVYINRTLNLNKYETFYFGGSYDLTGTYIVADKPIFVIAGNSADRSPYLNTDYIDPFNKCLPPVKDWGTHFTLVPFPPESQPFTAKILSSHDNCTLEYVNGTGSRVSVSLNKGEVKVLTSSTVLDIRSSEGILVAQFSKSRRVYDRYSNPSMLLSPHYGDAGRNEFIFPVFRLSADNGDETSYITIWLPPASNISLDNKNVSWNKIGEGTNGYRIVQAKLSSSSFHIIHGSKNITAVVCGVDKHKYYSYSLR